MAAGIFEEERACNIKDCEDTWGKFGIKPLKPGGNYFIWWHDPGDPDLSRRSLFTRDLQTARRKMVAWAQGLHPDYLAKDPLFLEVFADYLKTLPPKHQHRNVASMLSNTMQKHAAGVKFSQLYEARQKIWMEDLGKVEKYAPKTIAVCMSLISKVVTWATNTDENGLRKCRPITDKIIVKEKQICRLINIPVGKDENWAPEPEGMVRLILALQPHPQVLRWLLIMLTFGCRVEAACQASSRQLRWSQFDLLVPDTVQIENKWRPELPVAPSALREFRSWDEGPWVGLTADQVGRVLRSVRGKLGMPELKPRSIRDYIATMLRHAHVEFKVRYIQDFEQKTWQGHHRDDIHGRYGKYRPDYMIRSLVATEAMLRDLDFKSGGGLFRQGPDKTDINVLANQEDVEKVPELGVNEKTELPRETKVYIGPKRAKKGKLRPVQGSFRQASDRFVRRPDGTIDYLATLRRPSLEVRLRRMGVTVLEDTGPTDAKAEERDGADGVYLITNGDNVIPAVRAGELGKAARSPLPSTASVETRKPAQSEGPRYLAKGIGPEDIWKEMQDSAPCVLHSLSKCMYALDPEDSDFDTETDNPCFHVNHFSKVLALLDFDAKPDQEATDQP